MTVSSYGDITQNADLGIVTYPFGTVTFNLDLDNSGATNYTYTSGTIYATTNVNIVPQSITALTVSGMSIANNASLNIGSTKPFSVVVSGNLTLGGAGGVYIYSNGDITINANKTITSGGSLTLQADFDADKYGDITWGSGSGATIGDSGALIYLSLIHI